MFKNAGTQLKTLARICAGLTIVIGIILGITVSKTADSIIFFFVIALVSVLIAWVSNILLYAFGELCEDVKKISQK